MTAILASVRTPEEALLAYQGGADIIDLKEPEQGALGALPDAQIETILTTLEGRCSVSATVGDLATLPEIVLPAVKKMASHRVDYTKFGFFPGGEWLKTIHALHQQTRKQKLIAVFFAEALPEKRHLDALAAAGFYGAMIDTIHKSEGSLTERLSMEQMHNFIQHAQAQKLFSGLAGSLKIEDIEQLLPLSPDYLGFRGALCSQHNRCNQIDPERLQQIRSKIPTRIQK